MPKGKYERARASCVKCKLTFAAAVVGRHANVCGVVRPKKEKIAPSQPRVEELLAIGKIEVPDDPDACWIWNNYRFASGYGGTKKYGRAHRAMYWAATGEHPGEMFVCHSCDVPPCVNPRHLWLGDSFSNMADKMAKGRHVSTAGQSRPGLGWGFGENNPMKRDDVRAKVTGDSHWSKRRPEAWAAHHAKLTADKITAAETRRKNSQ